MKGLFSTHGYKSWDRCKCQHRWAHHSDGDNGPCFVNGCPCPVFDKYIPVDRITADLQALANDLDKKKDP